GRVAKARSAMAEVERAIAAAGRPGGSGTEVTEGHRHAESEIGKGYNPVSLKSELASMKARLVVESREWALMKGQGSFDNIDELFALGLAGLRLGDGGRADAALEHLRTAATTIPDRDAREIAVIMAAELDALIRFASDDRAGALASAARAAELESKRAKP